MCRLKQNCKTRRLSNRTVPLKEHTMQNINQTIVCTNDKYTCIYKSMITYLCTYEAKAETMNNVSISRGHLCIDNRYKLSWFFRNYCALRTIGTSTSSVKFWVQFENKHLVLTK